MILLYTLLALLLCTFAATICTMVFGLQKNKIVRKVIVCGLALCLVFGVVCGIGTAVCSNRADNIQATFEDLSLYYSTVSFSTNEYVRYDYYNKVLDYNAEFADALEQSKNIWFGGFYPKDWASNIDLISFQLHGDDYYIE